MAREVQKTTLEMERNVKAAILLMALFAGVTVAAPFNGRWSPEEGAQKKSGPKSRSSQQSLTGCVDEQDGNYVLLDDRMLNKVADLEAVGASNEALFAKHLGHKVIVKGTKSSAPEGRFKVTGIEDVSSECAPAQPNPQ